MVRIVIFHSNICQHFIPNVGESIRGRCRILSWIRYTTALFTNPFVFYFSSTRYSKMKRILFITICSLFLASSCTKEKTPFSQIPTCNGTVSFANDVMPLMEQNCTGCHNAGNASGGYNLSDHTTIAAHANAVLGSMRNSGYKLMPQGGPALPDSSIQLIECWIYQGKLDN